MSKEAAVNVEKVLPAVKAERFKELTANRYQISRQSSELEKCRKEIDEEIKALMAESGAVHIRVPNGEGDYFANLGVSSRTSLSEVKLIENGVAADVIANSKETKEFSVLRVDYKLNPPKM